MRVIILTFLILVVVNQNALVHASIHDKSCDELNISKLRDGDRIAYTNAVFDHAKIIFDKDLSQVSDSEIEALKKKMVTCKSNHPDYLGNISIKYIESTAEGVCKAFRNKRADAKTRAEAVSTLKSLKNQSNDIIVKINNGSVVDTEIETLRKLSVEAKSLYKKYNYQYSDFQTISSENQYAIEKFKQKQVKVEQEKVKQEELLQAKKEREQQKLNKHEESKKIYAVYANQNLGPTAKFFLSQFQTYHGNGASGDICSVIKFYDQLQGTKSWLQNPNTLVWVLTQESFNFKGESVVVKYYFIESTQDKGQIKKGMIWLEGVTINAQDYPYMNLTNFILEQLP